MTRAIPPPTGGEFDYLLREPHHARYWRRTIGITASIVTFVAALAPMMWAIRALAPHDLP